MLINNAEDLYVVMPVYNLLHYSKNYSKTTRSLWNYYRDEVSDDINDSNGLNKKIINVLNKKQALQEVLFIIMLL